MRGIRKTLLITVALWTFGLAAITAQADPPPQPIYTGERIEYNSVQWAADSQSLAFVAADGSPYQHYHYELTTDTLTQTPAHPFALTLSPEQQAHFEAAFAEVFPSPDGHYIIYEHRENTCTEYLARCWPKLGIGELETGHFQVIETGLAYQRWFIWSMASNAVLIPEFAEVMGGTLYVHNFEQGVENAEIKQLTSAQNGSDIYVAMHPNGEQVLLPAPFNRRTAGLYVWDVSLLDTPLLFTAQDSPIALADVPVAGATFDPERADHLYAVTDEGIVTLDWTAPDSQRIINPSIHADWVQWAYFSPDLRWIAVQPKPRFGFACQLYVLEVETMLDVDALLEAAPRCSFYG